MDMNQWREQVYIMFSRLLQEPDQELWSHIKDNQPYQLWNKAVDKYNEIIMPNTWLAEKFPNLEQWHDVWYETMGPVKPRIHPIESIFKPWTIDKSCKVPFAREKGYLQGDWAQHIKVIYEKIGLEVPSRFAHCPDHLILELELMSILIENADYHVQYQFMSQHLDWLKDLTAESKSKDVNFLYQDLFIWCSSYINADLDFVKKQSEALIAK